jgi:nicotinamidase-related amidase
VDTVVIAGVTTENCCHATARDAFSRLPGRVSVRCDRCSRLSRCRPGWHVWRRGTSGRSGGSPTPRPMFCPRTTSSHGQRFYN